MAEVSTIGLDIAKAVFHAHGADARGQMVFSRRLTRAKLLEFFAAQPRCVVALEACGGAADPWIRARVAGWVLDRLEDDDAFELSSRALPTLPPVPVALGPYALDEVLGEGGMGVVWRGRHTPTDRPVAVKVLRSGRPHDDAHAFAAEVALTSRLEHPAVVGVLDHGMVADSASLQSRGALTPGQPYLVLEYVPGGTLSDYVGRLSYPEVRAVAVALLDALGYAHARGVLHRDLKPENVLVTHDGAVRLTDFGLAVYRTDRAAGTPYYMSPEQYRGAPLDGRTDLYGLGCLLWHLVTGHPLFRGTLREVRDGHLGGERLGCALEERPPGAVAGRVADPHHRHPCCHGEVAAGRSAILTYAGRGRHGLRGCLARGNRSPCSARNRCQSGSCTSR